MGAKTYKVIIELGGTMSKPDLPIHLDGLLSSAKTVEDGGDWTNQHDLPIERFEGKSGWCFKASTLRFRPIAQEVVAKTNKIDVTHLAEIVKNGVTKIPNKVSTASGKYKADLYFDSVVLVDVVEAYVVTDSPERVLELLKTLRFIGGNKGLGLGLVKSVQLEEAVKEEADHWQHRFLPSEIDADCHPVVGRLRSPYWKHDEQVIVYNKAWNVVP